MEYTVYKIKADDIDREWEIPGLNESGAAEEAASRADGNGQVFVEFFRASDGQVGYLNRDGHGPVGRAW